MNKILFDGWYLDGSFAMQKDEFERRFDNLYDFKELTKHKKSTAAWLDLFRDWKKRGLLN